jgi:hypothetical protein
MQMNARPALLPRIGRLLRAKESLVFFAIVLALLDFAAPLGTGWLFRHRALATLLGTQNTVVGDAAAGRRAAVIGVAVAYLVVSTFFTAGYLRSLLGSFHWGPRDGRQFGRLLGLTVLVQAIRWGLAALAVAARGLGQVEVPLLYVVQLAVYVPLLYADYAIVASNVGVWQALVRSAQTFVANAFWSVFVLLVVFEVSYVLWLALPGTSGSALALSPTVLIHVLVAGCINFLSDVVLLSVYIDSIERGTIAPGAAGY